jgi:Ca2+-binding RTX toxin-like protein
VLEGRAGGDRLVGGRGSDTLRGGEGDDRLRARDGHADVVNCGAGIDRARIDFRDTIEDAGAQNPNGSCEVVTRGPRRHR